VAIQFQGASGTIAEVGAASYVPVHMSSRPVSYGTLGHYALAARTGLIGAGMAANGELMQSRWTDAAKFAVLYDIWLDEFDNTTAFTAGRFEFQLIIARAFSADGTGGTALTLTGDNNQMRTSMGTSLFGTIRIATTAALGPGTKTLDANPLRIIGGHVGAIANKHNIPQSPVVTTAEVAAGAGINMFQVDGGFHHPIVLATNEGVVQRGTPPGTGVWSATYSQKWAEVTAF